MRTAGRKMLVWHEILNNLSFTLRFVTCAQGTYTLAQVGIFKMVMNQYLVPCFTFKLMIQVIDNIEQLEEVRIDLCYK
jgi:hypothetical protein